jgi:Flp pilus assembly protein TadG
MYCDKNKKLLLLSKDGAAAVLVGVALFMLVSFAALAIDIGHLYVVKNELQNASDAAALSGARVLYSDDGTTVNINSNQTAFDTATANKSEKVPVDVHGLQGGDVERGHWSFTTGTFTPNSSTAVFDLWNVSTNELDTNVNFINAVRARTRREDTPAASFLAGIFGKDNFILAQEAVAYIGFAGTLLPGDAGMPLAICRDSLLMNGEYSCNMGRMINSGSNVQTSETGGWTSYAQQREPGDPDPCTGGTNANEVKQVIDPPGPGNCFGENIDPLLLGKEMASMGGEAETAMSALRNCWEQASDTDNDGLPDTPWNLTLPVIECQGNNVGVCEKVVGAVNVNVVWISGKGTSTCDFHPRYFDAVNNVWVEENLPPINIGDWSCAYQPPATDQEMQECWNSFVNHFNLQNVDGSTAPCTKKSLYFQPDCTPHEPAGRAGGENFGVLSKYPVLVK